MITSSSIKAGFGETGRYLEHGKGTSYTEDPGARVAWTAQRNLLGEKQEDIVLEMEGTAAMNERGRKPCYHLVISWSAGDPGRGIPPDEPTKEQMTEAADAALEVLGLEEHQAWIVAHKDGAAPHVHLMVNRVHPRTRKLWGGQWDYVKLWTMTREQEAKHGFRKLGPETMKHYWEQRSSGTFKAERATRSGRPHALYRWERDFTELSFREAVSKAVGHRIEEAREWAEVEAALSEYGLRLEPRYRRGMVVAAGEDYLAMSTVRPSFSRPKLEARFGETWEAYQREKLFHERTLQENEGPIEASSEAKYWASKEAEKVVTGSEERGRDQYREEAGGPHDLTGEQDLSTLAVEASLHLNDHQTTGTPMEEQTRSAAPENDALENDALENDALENDALENDALENDALETAMRTQKEEALNFAARYYREQMKSAQAGHPVRRYLQERGVASEVEEAFAVGFAPDDWNGLTRAAQKAGISGEILEETGLAHARKGGAGHFDRFRGRVMFPYAGEGGQVSGFGARRIEGLERETPTLSGNPKYINSPESDSFRKREELFGLSQAVGAIQERRAVYVTEGYTDAMRMREAGLPHTVALAGTRMTGEHAKRLREIAGAGAEVTFVFDGDAAGRGAATPAVRQAMAAGLTPRVVDLPPGQDADGFAREEGAEAFRGYLEEKSQSYGEHALRGAEEVEPYERAHQLRAALDTATTAPTPALREAAFQDVLEVATRGEEAGALPYRRRTYEEYFESALERQGLRRVSSGAEEDSLTRDSARAYDDFFGPPALQSSGTNQDADRSAAETYRAALTERRGAEKALAEARSAFEEKLSEVYADPEQAKAAWRANARAHGEEAGRDSVVEPSAYSDAQYLRPGEAKARDTLALYELERASVGMARAEHGVEAAFEQEEHAYRNLPELEGARKHESIEARSRRDGIGPEALQRSSESHPASADGAERLQQDRGESGGARAGGPAESFGERGGAGRSESRANERGRESRSRERENPSGGDGAAQEAPRGASGRERRRGAAAGGGLEEGGAPGTPGAHGGRERRAAGREEVERLPGAARGGHGFGGDDRSGDRADYTLGAANDRSFAGPATFVEETELSHSVGAHGEAQAQWQAVRDAQEGEAVREARSTLEKLSSDGRWAEEIMADAKRAERAFEKQLGETYRYPERAKDHFDVLVEEKGFSTAVTEVMEEPETLGSLKGAQAFGWENERRQEALTAAETVHIYGAGHAAHEAARRHILEAQAKLAAYEGAQLAYYKAVDGPAKAGLKRKMGTAQRAAEEVREIIDEYQREAVRIADKADAFPTPERAQEKVRESSREMSEEGQRLMQAQAEAVGVAGERVEEARAKVQGRRAEAQRSSQGIDEAFGKLYQNPGDARRGYERASGFDTRTPQYIDAAQQMLKAPGQFGEVKSGLTPREVKSGAQAVVHAHQRYANSYQQLQTAHKELSAAKESAQVIIQKTPGLSRGKTGSLKTLRSGRLGRAAGGLAAMGARKVSRELRQASGIDRDI